MKKLHTFSLSTITDSELLSIKETILQLRETSSRRNGYTNSKQHTLKYAHDVKKKEKLVSGVAHTYVLSRVLNNIIEVSAKSLLIMYRQPGATPNDTSIMVG